MSWSPSLRAIRTSSVSGLAAPVSWSSDTPSVITHWIKALNLREAQHWSGHRYVSSTEAYLINDLEGLAEDVERYHPIG